MEQVHEQTKIRRIRLERLKRHWRLEDLAHFARVSAADISRIETGRMIPYPTHAKRLAEVLGIEPEELTTVVDTE